MIEEQRLREVERDQLMANLDQQITVRDRQIEEIVRRMKENYT